MSDKKMGKEKKLILRVVSAALTVIALLLSAMKCAYVPPEAVKDLAEDIAEVISDVQDIRDGKEVREEPCEKK